MISNNAGPVNEFTPELWSLLTSRLEAVAGESKGPLIAAFDADGTLWDADAGETFFDWQIHHSGLRSLPADPWSEYLRLKKPDPRVAYVWLAQISAGHSLSEVRQWASRCFSERAPWPVFVSQKRLIDFMRGLGFEIFVVTASVKWAVEPVAALVGIDHDHVVGVETEVVNGIVTSTPRLPITWRSGKAEGLLARTGGVRPVFASGNTVGDIALLDCATTLQLAVCTQNKPGSLFDEETKLWQEASQRQWPRHAFRERKD